MPLPGADLPHHRLPVRDPPVEALPGEDVYLDLRHVKPAPVLRRVVDLEAVREPRRLRRPGRLVQGRQPVGVGLSITRTVFLSGKWTSAMSASSLAKSLFVRRSVTFTWRHASSGAYTMNRFAVPLRPYSKSYAAGCPGRVGSGVRVSPVCCFEVPSMTARTVPSSYSRLQVFRTSSMAQTDSALSFGGMHQHWSLQGLMSFFSDAMGRAAVCLRG